MGKEEEEEEEKKKIKKFIIWVVGEILAPKFSLHRLQAAKWGRSTCLSYISSRDKFTWTLPRLLLTRSITMLDALSTGKIICALLNRSSNTSRILLRD